MTAEVPDDKLQILEGPAYLDIYVGIGDIHQVTVRVGDLPLKLGEKVEVEVVRIERRTYEKLLE